MSNFFEEDENLLQVLESENTSTYDSNDIKEACKKISLSEKICENQKQNEEKEKKEDKLRYFTYNYLETSNSLKTSNSTTVHIFNVFNKEKNNSNILLNKKRGRKQGNIIKRIKYKNHDKYDKDNVLTKIQSNSINFIPKYLNEILPKFNFNKRERFYLIDYELKKKVNKEYSDYLKTLKLSDIVQMKISPKCTAVDKNHNINLYNKVKNIPVINNILEEKYLSFFQNVYFRSERKINLKKYGLDIDIFLSDKIKMYNDIIKSFEDKNCINIIQRYVNKRYFDNKLFFLTEK